jgi:hypothetical protein
MTFSVHYYIVEYSGKFVSGSIEHTPNSPPCRCTFRKHTLLHLTVINAHCFVHGLQRSSIQQGILLTLQELARQLRKHAKAT